MTLEISHDEAGETGVSSDHWTARAALIKRGDTTISPGVSRMLGCRWVVKTG